MCNVKCVCVCVCVCELKTNHECKSVSCYYLLYLDFGPDQWSHDCFCHEFIMFVCCLVIPLWCWSGVPPSHIHKQEKGRALGITVSDTRYM